MLRHGLLLLVVRRRLLMFLELIDYLGLGECLKVMLLLIALPARTTWGLEMRGTSVVLDCVGVELLVEFGGRDHSLDILRVGIGWDRERQN